jgi:hypothetical protein
VQVEFEQLINTIRAGIGLVPPVVIAIVLLGGPTAGWLLYRFVVQPRNMRMLGIERTAMWVCPDCRSVNGLLMDRCYRCDAAPLEDQLELIDARPEGPVPLTAVGPGLDLDRPAARPHPLSLIERIEESWTEEDRAALPDVAAMTEVVEASGGGRSARNSGPVPVGPGRPTVARPVVARPRRAVVAGSAQDPDGTPAA